MPVVWVGLRTGDAKSKDIKPRFVLPSDMIGRAAAMYVADQRRAAIARREEMLALQKESADRESARFFKDEARDALKFYRAACLLLPHVDGGDLPGDCLMTDAYDWPSELFPALCLISAGAAIA